MSKKLGLESKYKQFINPTKLGEYKAIMGKGTSSTPTKGTFKERRYALSANPTKSLAKAASSVLKRSPVGRIVTAIGKAVTSKPGMFGAGIGIGSNVKKENKKMGGGMMMKYKTGKDVKLSPKQKKIAAMAGDPKRIDAPDFAKLRTMKAKTGKEAKISKVMKEYKEGKLNIGKSKKKVKNKKQAIAIALSEARKKNA